MLQHKTIQRLLTSLPKMDHRSLLYDIKSLNNIARSTAPKTMLPQFDIIFDELFVGTKASTFDPLRFN